MLKSKDSLSELLEKVCSFLDGLNNAIEINKSETTEVSENLKKDKIIKLQNLNR